MLKCGYFSDIGIFFYFNLESLKRRKSKTCRKNVPPKVEWPSKPNLKNSDYSQPPRMSAGLRATCMSFEAQRLPHSIWRILRPFFKNMEAYCVSNHKVLSHMLRNDFVLKNMKGLLRKHTVQIMEHERTCYKKTKKFLSPRRRKTIIGPFSSNYNRIIKPSRSNKKMEFY